MVKVPSNLVLNKIGKPAIYLPVAMAIWGVISMATAAAQTFGRLIATRFSLGFVEAAYFVRCLFLSLSVQPLMVASRDVYSICLLGTLVRSWVSEPPSCSRVISRQGPSLASLQLVSFMDCRERRALPLGGGFS